MLREHWESKHPKETDIVKAFPHLAQQKCVATTAPGATTVKAAKAGADEKQEKSSKQKSKDAAALAAAALAAAAGGAPAKPKKKKAAAEDEAAATGAATEELTVSPPSGDVASAQPECAPVDFGPVAGVEEAVPAPMEVEATEEVEPVAEVVETAEERAARLALQAKRQEADRQEVLAREEATAAAAWSASKLSVEAQIEAGALSGLKSDEWGMLCDMAWAARAPATAN